MNTVRVGIATLAISSMAWGASAQTSTVRGLVTNREGAPVGNAEVSLVPPPSAMSSMPGMRPSPSQDRTARSGADGAFQIDQVPAGQYVLQVDAAGLSRSSQAVTVPNSFFTSVASMAPCGVNTAIF